jgi:hypothetical protein
MIYLANTMPPDYTSILLQHFDNAIVSTVRSILNADIREAFIFDALGAGFPCYTKAAHQLYAHSREMSLKNNDKGAEVRLVLESLPHTAGIRSQHDAEYMFFAATTPISALSPSQFCMAMCIRLRTMPKSMLDFPKRCPCNAQIDYMHDFIEHALCCEKYGHATHTQRHNAIRDTMIAVARSYGITCTKEPDFYVYKDGIKHRPDITFHTAEPIATDVTIVYPHTAPGTAAKAAASVKENAHTDAVNMINHRFIPFAMEVYGHRDESCFRLIDALRKQLPRHLQYAFTFEMNHAVSCTLARERVLAIISARHYRSDDATF